MRGCMMRGDWSVVDSPAGVHSIPEGDLVIHVEREDCFCCPSVELHVVRHTGYMWVRHLVVHNAMDGRE